MVHLGDVIFYPTFMWNFLFLQAKSLCRWRKVVLITYFLSGNIHFQRGSQKIEAISFCSNIRVSINKNWLLLFVLAIIMMIFVEALQKLKHVSFQLCKTYPDGVIWKKTDYWRQIYEQTNLTFYTTHDRHLCEMTLMTFQKCNHEIEKN